MGGAQTPGEALPEEKARGVGASGGIPALPVPSAAGPARWAVSREVKVLVDRGGRTPVRALLTAGDFTQASG